MWAPISKLLSLLSEARTNLIGLVTAVAVVAVLYHGIKYKQGDDSEKANAIRNIKGTVYGLVGIALVVWLVTYAWGKFGVS